MKPGIVYSNVLMAAAGFLLASKWHGSLGVFLSLLGGIALVIASACIFNNYLDRDIDAKMARTRRRALVSGTISPTRALTMASVLGVLGFSLLLVGTNFLATAVAWGGYVVYILLYSPLKRRTVYSTVIGSISGAVPPVVGYCAVNGSFDLAALLLLLILVFWQMPHFYAIAIYRYDDYKAAGLPVLPVAKGFHAAKLQIVAYMLGFLASVTILTFVSDAGYVYLVLSVLMALSWLVRGIRGFGAKDDKRWARGVFLHSLGLIAALSVLIAVASVLP
jgi:protoheme IX farnesyltransferase